MPHSLFDGSILSWQKHNPKSFPTSNPLFLIISLIISVVPTSILLSKMITSPGFEQLRIGQEWMHYQTCSSAIASARFVFRRSSHGVVSWNYHPGLFAY